MLELADLKTYLKITDSASDNQLNLAISNAKGFLKDYLGYSLELDASRKAIFYWYSNEFNLKYTKINGISDISYADDEFDPDFTTYNISTNYKVFNDVGLVKTRDKIGPYIEITYSFGYDSGEEAVNPTPSGLKAILLDVSAMYFKSMGEISQADVKSETVDGDNITFSDISWKLSPNALALLDNYKIYDFSA